MLKDASYRGRARHDRDRQACAPDRSKRIEHAREARRVERGDAAQVHDEHGGPLGSDIVDRVLDSRRNGRIDVSTDFETDDASAVPVAADTGFGAW